MNEHFAGWDERTLDLAILEVTVGLGATVGLDVTVRRASREREHLLARIDARDLAQFEHAVAVLNLAGLGTLEPLPEGLRKRIEADAPRHLHMKRGQPPDP